MFSIRGMTEYYATGFPAQKGPLPVNEYVSFSSNVWPILYWFINWHTQLLLFCWCYLCFLFNMKTDINKASYNITMHCALVLKEYYEIVGEPRPLSGFPYKVMLIFFYRNAFLIMKLSNPPIDPSPNCFTIDVWKIKCWLSTVYFLLSYCFCI